MREVMDLMASGSWRASMALQLAAKWKVTEAAVRVYSCEAGRRLQHLAGDRAEYEAKVEAMLDHAVEMAKAETRYPSKGAEALARIGDVYMKLRGLTSPTKLEHSGPDGGPVQLTPVIMVPPESDD